MHPGGSVKASQSSGETRCRRREVGNILDARQFPAATIGRALRTAFFGRRGNKHSHWHDHLSCARRGQRPGGRILEPPVGRRTSPAPVAGVPVSGATQLRVTRQAIPQQGTRSRTRERLPHHRRNIERRPGGRTYPTFRGTPARMAQSIVRATAVGYEEFYVLLERRLFNPAPVEHIHTCQRGDAHQPQIAPV
jgi:hypothetical protein